MKEIKEDGRMYYCFSQRHIGMLIPKKRGNGFMKTPVFHNVTPLSQFIADLGYDCCGLDGSLDIMTGYTHGREKEPTNMVNKISKFLRVEAVEVSHHTLYNYLTT